MCPFFLLIHCSLYFEFTFGIRGSSDFIFPPSPVFWTLSIKVFLHKAVLKSWPLPGAQMFPLDQGCCGIAWMRAPVRASGCSPRLLAVWQGAQALNRHVLHTFCLSAQNLISCLTFDLCPFRRWLFTSTLKLWPWTRPRQSFVLHPLNFPWHLSL